MKYIWSVLIVEKRGNTHPKPRYLGRNSCDLLLFWGFGDLEGGANQSSAVCRWNIGAVRTINTTRSVSNTKIF